MKSKFTEFTCYSQVLLMFPKLAKVVIICIHLDNPHGSSLMPEIHNVDNVSVDRTNLLQSTTAMRNVCRVIMFMNDVLNHMWDFS